MRPGAATRPIHSGPANFATRSLPDSDEPDSGDRLAEVVWTGSRSPTTGAAAGPADAGFHAQPDQPHLPKTPVEIAVVTFADGDDPRACATGIAPERAFASATTRADPHTDGGMTVRWKWPRDPLRGWCSPPSASMEA
jgi:hypothetical protein